jgi:hypothetical protein
MLTATGKHGRKLILPAVGRLALVKQYAMRANEKGTGK